MSFLFGRPDPQQSVPGDLGGFRNQILQALTGQGGRGGLLGTLFGIAGGGPTDAFGNIQGPTTALQRGGTNSILRYLNQPAPEERALGISLPALQQQLSGTPGSDILEPLEAVSNRRLTEQLGQIRGSVPGRFSSAAIDTEGRARTSALQDYNLLSAQVMEQGRRRQLDAANTLGVLSSAAGQQPFGRAAMANQLGQQEGQFAQNRQLQVLMALLGLAGGPAFGGPFTQGASPWENLLGGAGTVLPFLGGGGGGGGSGPRTSG